MKKRLLVLVMMVLFMMPLMLQAKPRFKGMDPKIVKELGLSKQKVKEIKSVMKKYRPKDMKGHCLDQKKALMDELGKSSPDMGRIEQIKKEILAKKAKKLDKMIQMKLELKKHFTAEQWKKFREIKEERCKMMKEKECNKPRRKKCRW